MSARSNRLSSFLDARLGSARRPLVKICGLTSIDDARAAASAGADLLGFNLWPGTPRHVSVEKAEEMASVLRGDGESAPEIVLVCVEPDPGWIEEAVRRVGPLAVQVHGATRSREVAGVAVIEAHSIGGMPDVEAVNAGDGELVLIDARVEGMHGGTGRSIPAEFVRAVKRPYLLAGGLTPENVGRAVREFDPLGVDVASGVESSPGRKDPARIAAFVRAAKGSRGPGGNR